MSRRSPWVLPVMLMLVVVAPALQGCAFMLMRQQGDDTTPPAPVVSARPTVSTAPEPSRAPGELPSPSELVVLTTDDFAAVGVEGATAPTFDPNGSPGAVYAVYAGLSGAAGGIEVDVFVSETEDEAASLVQDPGLYALDAGSKAATGADRATLIAEQSTNDGSSSYDTLWVQKGRLAAAISVPHTETSKDALVRLAALLLTRTAAYQ